MPGPLYWLAGIAALAVLALSHYCGRPGANYRGFIDLETPDQICPKDYKAYEAQVVALHLPTASDGA
jgi:hypothetical protein